VTFTYTPEYRSGLTFTWEGGEYIDTNTNAVINVWDAAKNAPEIERTQEAFEAACDEWVRYQDPADGQIGDEVADLPLSLLLRADGVTLSSHLVAMGTDNEGWVHREYRVTLAYDGRTLTRTVKHGGEEGDAPELVDTVGMLVSDSWLAFISDDYEDWASNYSSDPEKWMPEETYSDNLKVAEDLRTLLGAARFERYAMADHDA
jgi:hypothetical protein